MDMYAKGWKAAIRGKSRKYGRRRYSGENLIEWKAGWYGYKAQHGSEEQDRRMESMDASKGYSMREIAGRGVKTSVLRLAAA